MSLLCAFEGSVQRKDLKKKKSPFFQAGEVNGDGPSLPDEVSPN